MLKIALLEPFFTGSHKSWAEGYKAHSKHEVEIVSMEGRYWKWRMHGSAYTLSQKVLTLSQRPDIFLATDMLDVPAFRGFLPPDWANIPIVLYMHENQLTYPWSPTDQDVKGRQDRHYAFLNYRSMLAADAVWFNSAYHLSSLFDALPAFLRAFPDYQGMETLKQIKDKSRVMPLGVKLADLVPNKKSPPAVPAILWNHRWEYDKGPDTFFQTLFRLKDEGHAFKLIVAGQPFPRRPRIFDEAKQVLQAEIIHWGYAANREAYIELLKKADIQPITSTHDFFGISAVEALAAGVFPLFPNRLAYPEHIPSSLHPQHIYEDDTDLYERLSMLLKNPQLPSLTLATYVQQYEWATLSHAYDTGIQAYRPKNFS